jgi:hypothetical protein
MFVVPQTVRCVGSYNIEKINAYSNETPVTLRILHFGVITIGGTGISGMGELTVRHTSD